MMPPKITAPRPPCVGSPGPDRSLGGRRIATAPAANNTSKGAILANVSRNCIVNAVVKNKISMARNERHATKCKTRQEILAAMDLQELHVERAVMARMGFLDKLQELDAMLEAKRVRLKKEREQQDQSVLEEKMNDLQVSHERRSAAMDSTQAAQLIAHREKCAAEVAELKCKQKNEYDVLVGEAATKATGGVVSCLCTAPYKCRHNKSALYNMRKPGKEVLRLRQNGRRLRASGRLQEADEVDNAAAAIEGREEHQWRTRVEESILLSSWYGGKSRLEQMVERQQAALQALTSTHEERLARLEQQNNLARRNLLLVLAAERKKVILSCRRESVRQRTQELPVGAKQARKMKAHTSDRTKNVPKNVSKDGKGSVSDIGSDDNERLEGWDPPTMPGVGNGKLLLTRGDSASSNAHLNLAGEAFENCDTSNNSVLKTPGAWEAEACGLKQTGVYASSADPAHGGAQTNVSRFAAQPPTGGPPSVASLGPGARSKVQMDNDGKKGSETGYGGCDREGKDEEEEEEEDKGDFSGSGEPCGTGEGGGGEGAPCEPPRGSSGSRGGLPQKSVPAAGPLSAPMLCTFPVEEFDGPPGGSPRGSPDLPVWAGTGPCSAEGLCRSPSKPPGALSGSPRGLTVSLFPARGFGWPSDGPPAETPQGSLREVMTSSFPAGGVGRPQGGPPSAPAASSSKPFASEGSREAFRSGATRSSEPAGFPIPTGVIGGPEGGADSEPLSALDGTVAKSPFSSEGTWNGLLLTSRPASAVSVTTSRGSAPNLLPVGIFCVTPDGSVPPTGCSVPSRSPAASGYPAGAFNGPPGRPPSAFRNRPAGVSEPSRGPTATPPLPTGFDEPPEPSESTSITLMMARAFTAALFGRPPLRSLTGPSDPPSRPAAKSSPDGRRWGPRNKKTVGSAGSTVDVSESKKGGCAKEQEDQGENERGGGCEGGEAGEGSAREERGDKEDEAEEFGGEGSGQDDVRTRARARLVGDLTQDEEGRKAFKRAAATKTSRGGEQGGQRQELEDEENGEEENERREAPADSGKNTDFSDTDGGAGIASSEVEGDNGDHDGRYQNQREERKVGGVGEDEDNTDSGRSFGEKNEERRPLSPAEKSALVNLTWDAFIFRLSELNISSSNDGASGNLPSNRDEHCTLGSSTASPIVSGGRVPADAREEHREDEKKCASLDCVHNREHGDEDGGQSASKGLDGQAAATGAEKIGGEIGSRHAKSSNAFSQISSTVVDGESETYKEAVCSESAVVIAAAAGCGSKHSETFQGEARDATGSIIHSGSTYTPMSADSTNSAFSVFNKSGEEGDARVDDLEERGEEKGGRHGDASFPGKGGGSEDGGGGGGEGLIREYGVPCAVSSPANGSVARKGMETKAIQSSIDTTLPEGDLNGCATAIGTQLGVGGYENSGAARAEYGEGIDQRHLNVATTAVADRTLADRETGEPKDETSLEGGKEDASSDTFESQGGTGTSAYTELIDQGPAGNKPGTCSEREEVGDRSETQDAFPLAEGYHSAQTALPAPTVSNIGTGEEPSTTAPTFEGSNSDEADIYDISDGSASTGTPEGTVEGNEGARLRADTPDDERGSSGRSAADSAGSTEAFATGCGEGEEQASPATADDVADDKEIDQSMGTEVTKPSPSVDLRGVVHEALPGGRLALLTPSPGVVVSDDSPALRDGVVESPGEVIGTANICSAESDLRENVDILGADARRLVEETAVGQPTRPEERDAGTPAHQRANMSSHVVGSDEEPRICNKACQTRW